MATETVTWILAIVLLVASITWARFDALKRGRSLGSASKWAFAIFLLWVIAFPLYFILRPKRPGDIIPGWLPAVGAMAVTLILALVPYTIDSDRPPAGHRNALVKSLERDITSSAKKHVSEALLEGPIDKTRCKLVDEITGMSGRYRCFAEIDPASDGASMGYTYRATVDFIDGTYTWELED